MNPARPAGNSPAGSTGNPVVMPDYSGARQSHGGMDGDNRVPPSYDGPDPTSQNWGSHLGGRGAGGGTQGPLTGTKS